MGDVKRDIEQLLQTVNGLKHRVRLIEEKEKAGERRRAKLSQAESDGGNYVDNNEVKFTSSRSKTRCLCAFWTIYIAVCVALLAFQTVTSVLHYLEYSIQTRYTIQQYDAIGLPDITVCNINPVKISKIKDNPALLEIYNDLTTTNPPNVTGLASIAEYETFLDAFRRLPVNDRKSLGYQLHDFVFHEMHGLQVERRNLTTFMYGNCFTDTILQPQSQQGYKNGYAMAVDMKIDEYILSGSNPGMKVFIHEPKTPPRVQDISLIIHPGDTAFIKVSHKMIKAIEEPYGQCRDKNNDRNGQDGYLYTVMACKDQCLLDDMKERCGCVPLDHILMVHDTSVNLCNKTNTTQTNCTNTAMGNKVCSCPRSCTQTEYNPTVVIEERGIPGTAGAKSGEICEDQNLLNNFATSKECIDYMKRNVATLYMYAANFLVDEIKEEAEETLQSLLAGISSLMGFISLLTLCIVGIYCVASRARIN